MLREILESFVNKVGEGNTTFTNREGEFLNHLLKLTPKERSLVLAPDADEEKAFGKIKEWGFEDVIISIAEKMTSLSFVNVKELDRNDNIDNLARSQTLATMGVFSTLIDNKIVFVISRENQLEAIKEHCDVSEYEVYLSWPWDIYEKNKTLGLIIQDIKGKNQHIIMATGQTQIDNIAKYFNGFVVDKIVEYRKDLFSACKQFSPDILVVSDNVGGNEELISILIKIKAQHPKTRIIYFTSELQPRDEVRKNLISVLINLGVYDIMFDNRFSVDMLKYLLGNPNPYSAVKGLVVKTSQGKIKKKDIELISNSDESGSLILHTKEHIYSFISPKGGTGKTFIAGNVAKAIGKYGIPKDGKKVKVAIIDGDFYGGGISNLFNISDKKKNILTAIEAVAGIMSNGRMTDDEVSKQLAFEKIRDCFIPIDDCKNIEILGAYPEQLTEEQFGEIQGEYIQIILESVQDDFDVVIVDITGDFELKVWFPTFTLSRNIFSITEMEFNSISSCIKQKPIIADFVGNQNKIQYIFNKVVDNEYVIWNIDKIKEDKILEVSAIVPYIDRTYMINNAFECKWLIDTENEEDQDVKYSLLKIANKIWPIKDLTVFKKAAKIEKEEENDDPMKMPKSFKELISVGSKILFPFTEEAEKKAKMYVGIGTKGVKDKLTSLKKSKTKEVKTEEVIENPNTLNLDKEENADV